MRRTRIVKSRNTQAVRTPAGLAYSGMDPDVAHNGLRDAVAVLRKMPKPPASEKRRTIDVPLRGRIERM
jgi:hypothetical protein